MTIKLLWLLQGAVDGRFRNTNYPTYVLDVSFGVHIRVPYIRKVSSWDRLGIARLDSIVPICNLRLSIGCEVIYRIYATCVVLW